MAGGFSNGFGSGFATGASAPSGVTAPGNKGWCGCCNCCHIKYTYTANLSWGCVADYDLYSQVSGDSTCYYGTGGTTYLSLNHDAYPCCRPDNTPPGIITSGTITDPHTIYAWYNLYSTDCCGSGGEGGCSASGTGTVKNVGGVPLWVNGTRVNPGASFSLSIPNSGNHGSEPSPPGSAATFKVTASASGLLIKYKGKLYVNKAVFLRQQKMRQLIGIRKMVEADPAKKAAIVALLNAKTMRDAEAQRKATEGQSQGCGCQKPAAQSDVKKTPPTNI